MEMNNIFDDIFDLIFQMKNKFNDIPPHKPPLQVSSSLSRKMRIWFVDQ